MYNPAERSPTVTTPVSQVKTGTARRGLIMAWLGNRPWIDDEEHSIYAQEDEETQKEHSAFPLPIPEAKSADRTDDDHAKT